MWKATDLAYFAGLLDGEGCIGVYAGKTELSHRQKRPRVVYRPRLTITNTDRRMLDWVVERFGGYVLERPRQNKDKAVFRWHLQGPNNVQPIMAAVRPYLVIKREQADLILAFPANAVCNQWTVDKTAAIQAAKRGLYLETKRLNRRGYLDAVAAV